jgi:hypothetical protein
MRVRSDQGRKNRRGCVAIGVIALAIVLLITAIALGWFGAIDAGKNTGLPITDNRM